MNNDSELMKSETKPDRDVDALRLLAEQGDRVAQFDYGAGLARGDGFPMNKSLAAHYFTLSADQGFV
jgi:TPR repeat protein